MNRLQSHLRNTFLAGVLGFIPLAVTVFIILWIDSHTRVLSEAIFGRSIPGVGIVLALALIYATGLVATTLMGKFVLRLIDRLLGHVPILSKIYEAWKHVALTPGGTEGTFSKVALLTDESGQFRVLAFTSGKAIGPAGKQLCLFVPNAPNPTQGRMLLVPVDQCKMLDTSPEDAFKMILSTGNFIPEELRAPLDSPAIIQGFTGETSQSPSDLSQTSRPCG